VRTAANISDCSGPGQARGCDGLLSHGDQKEDRPLIERVGPGRQIVLLGALAIELVRLAAQLEDLEAQAAEIELLDLEQALDRRIRRFEEEA
jgi:hypothetical protein